MPTYEYRCSRCGVMEDIKLKEPRSDRRCKRCFGILRRVYSTFIFNFKGGVLNDC